MNLFKKACSTSLHSRFVARAEGLGRDLTDEETVEEAKYLLDTIPYAGLEDYEVYTAIKELKKIINEAATKS